MKKKKAMTMICFLAAAVCLVYYFLVAACSGFRTSFAWFWPFCTVFFGGMGGLLLFDRLHPRTVPAWFFRGVLILFAAGVLALLLLLGKIAGAAGATAPEELPFVVVLGAKVRGETPTRALRYRMEAALDYAKKNPDTILILSGGQGPDEEISEAECMRRWLTEHGMEESRLLLEDRSTDTRENLIFSDEKSGCGKGPFGIATSDFHVYRALRLAGGLGFPEAYGIAAPTKPAVMLPHYAVREAFAIVKEVVSRHF